MKLVIFQISLPEMLTQALRRGRSSTSPFLENTHSNAFSYDKTIFSLTT